MNKNTIHKATNKNPMCTTDAHNYSVYIDKNIDTSTHIIHKETHRYGYTYYTYTQAHTCNWFT